MLPAYQINPMLDFSPVSNALDSYQKQMNTNAQLGMQQRREDREQATFDETQKQRTIDRMGRVGKMILELPENDPRRAALSTGLRRMNPEMDTHLQNYGIDPNNTDAMARFVVAQTSDYNPTAEKLKQAQINSANASAGLHTAQAGNIGKTDNIREFDFAKRNGYAGTFEQWQKDVEARSTKYGLNPIAYRKPDGTIGYMVPSTSGQTRDLEIPSAGQAMPKTTTVQTPTEAIVQDQFGNVLRREQKDIVGKERAEEIGKSQGKAIADLPRIQGNAERALATIDQIEKHPGKAYGVGAVGVIPGIPGTRQRGFINLVDQAKGQTFLEAFNSLRGGGAITEAEGAKATQALARLDRAQSMEDFDAALNDLKGIVQAGLARAKSQTTVGSQPASSSTPTRGTLPSGVTYERLD